MPVLVSHYVKSVVHIILSVYCFFSNETTTCVSHFLKNEREQFECLKLFVHTARYYCNNNTHNMNI